MRGKIREAGHCAHERISPILPHFSRTGSGQDLHFHRTLNHAVIVSLLGHKVANFPVIEFCSVLNDF